MADEFLKLQNVSLISESDLRDDVAANIEAKSSKEFVADQTLLKNAWRAFQEAEELVNNLHGQLRDAELNEANKAIGVSGSSGHTQHNNNSNSNQNPTSQPSLSAAALRFKHNTALRELDKKGEKLRQVQREVEERQRKRLEEIRNRQRTEAASHEQMRVHRSISSNNDDDMHSVTTNTMHEQSGVNVELSSSPTVATVRGNHHENNKNNVNIKSNTLHRNQLQLREHTARPQRVLGTTMTSYSGGAVLPSLNRVLVSHADIQAKHLRYEDDADIALYAARLRKRKKLEKANALLRAQRRQEQVDRGELQSSQTSSEFTDFTDTQSIITSASTNTNTNTATTITANTDTLSNTNTNNFSQSRLQQNTEMQNERKSSNNDVKREQKVVHVKRENESHDQLDNNQFTCSTTTASAEKANNKMTNRGDNCVGRVKMENEDKVQHHQPKENAEEEEKEANDDNPIAAIDIDALMEEEEDVGDDLVQKLLTQQQRKSSSSFPLETRTSDKEGKEKVIKKETSALEEEEEEEKELIESNAVKTRHSSKNTHLIDYSHITLKPERQVEIIPGIKISARIYRRLFPYQQDGLRWLLHLHSHRTGGILGDEMGLGKTVQIAVLLNALCSSHQLRGPVLIICPMTVLRQWVAEIHRWAPYVRVCVMHISSSSSANISREALMQSVQGTPAVVLTTYAALRQQVHLLHSAGFQYIILDEGHKIANPEASITLAAKSFATPHRIILTGSPIQNSLKELWCLFDFVKPGLLGTLSKFIEEFEQPIGQSKNPRASPLALATAVECARALQVSIAPYLLRRLKHIVNASLPRRYERIVRVCLTEEQLQCYVDTLASPSVQRLFSQALFYPKLSGSLNNEGRDATGALHVAGRRFYLSPASAGLSSSSLSSSSSQLYQSGANSQHGSGHGFSTRGRQTGLHLESFRVMNQLRQICNHADLNKVLRGLEEEERLLSAPGLGVSVLHRHQMNHNRRRQQQNLFNLNSNSGGSGTRSSGISIGYRSFRSNNPVNVMGSGKLQALQQMLREWHKFQHRVLVFSQTRMMLDIIENLCEQENYKYIRMDGTTGNRHRQELIDRFNEDERIFVALLTTRVGGIGVNLTGADRVVIYDPDWNPITDIQARERAWRIGQTREVCVYRLITRGTVEEAILRRQLAKTYVTDKVLKDPTLQRFFHVQESFVENFFLGSEYEDRVPAGKKHVLAAKQILTDTRRLYGDDPYSAHNHSLFADEVHEQEPVQPSTAHVNEPNSHTNNTINDSTNKAINFTRDDNNVSNKTDNDVTEADHATEKEFGSLAEIITDEEALPSASGEAREATSPTTANTVNNTNTGNDETGLLKRLINGQEVSISGADSIAQQLAHASAERALFRATHDIALGKPLRTAQDQRREFSLSKAAEEFKAKDAADRAEQRRYYEEDMRRLRARQRKLH